MGAWMGHVCTCLQSSKIPHFHYFYIVAASYCDCTLVTQISWLCRAHGGTEGKSGEDVVHSRVHRTEPQATTIVDARKANSISVSLRTAQQFLDP